MSAMNPRSVATSPPSHVATPAPQPPSTAQDRGGETGSHPAEGMLKARIDPGARGEPRITVSSALLWVVLAGGFVLIGGGNPWRLSNAVDLTSGL